MTKSLAENNLKGECFTCIHNFRVPAMKVEKAPQLKCEAAASSVSTDQEAENETKARDRPYPSKARLSDPLLQGTPHTSQRVYKLPQTQGQVSNLMGLWEDTLRSNNVVTNWGKLLPMIFYMCAV